MRRAMFAKSLLLSALAVAGTAAAADKVRIANEGAIRDQWMLADGIKLAAPGYPAEFVDRGDNVCLALGYAIGKDGATSDFSIVKSWTSSQAPVPAGYWETFAQAGASALSQWRFKPRPEVDQPQTTYTVATLQFMGKQAMDGAALRANCKVEDLAAEIANPKAVGRNNERIRQELERYIRATQSTQRMNPVPMGGSVK